MTDIEPLHAAGYRGHDPLDWAIFNIENLLEARQTCHQRRDNGLPPLPAWHDLSDTALARKVIGVLLGAGWQPPSDEDVRAAVEISQAASARFDAWWAGLTAEQRNHAIDHYSTTGEFPKDLRPADPGAAA